jgi:hypothetical protein
MNRDEIQIFETCQFTYHKVCANVNVVNVLKNVISASKHITRAAHCSEF